MASRVRKPPKPADVLLVDDDASGLFMLGLVLRQAGLSVVGCPGALEALEHLRRRPFRWLVTDAKMSPRDGFSLADEARLIRPDLRIVMISASCGDDELQGHPIERLFTKPVPVEALVSFLDLRHRHPHPGGRRDGQRVDP